MARKTPKKPRKLPTLKECQQARCAYDNSFNLALLLARIAVYQDHNKHLAVFALAQAAGTMVRTLWKEAIKKEEPFPGHFPATALSHFFLGFVPANSVPVEQSDVEAWLLYSLDTLLRLPRYKEPLATKTTKTTKTTEASRAPHEPIH